MTKINLVEQNVSKTDNYNQALTIAVDDSMSKKIYECRLRLDDEKHKQMKIILNKFEKSGMSDRVTIGFVLEVGMIISMNLYKSRHQIWNYVRTEVKGLCEEDEYRKDKIYVNFVRKFNDSPDVEELFGVHLDGRVLEKMKNFSKMIGEILDLKNEIIMEDVLENGIKELYRTENAEEIFLYYQDTLEFRQYY
jgi:hypothetical protein